MTSFTFSAEQVRSAPPEVRRWIEREIAASLAAMSKSEHDPSQVHAASLAACMPEEAMQLFELIKGNFPWPRSSSSWRARRQTVMARRRSTRSASPISCVTRGSATAIGSSIALPLSIRRFSRSATIPKRHYSDLINTVMCSFTTPPTTAFARSGNSSSPRVHRSQADQSRERGPCRQGSHRLIWGPARISRSTRRVPPPLNF